MAEFDVEESILKIILIDDFYLCACSSKNIFLIKYGIINENIERDNKNENLNEIINIKFDI